MPRDVGSILIMYVGFGVTFWNSNFWGGGGVIFPEGSIGCFWLGAGDFWTVIGMCLNGQRGIGNERLHDYVTSLWGMGVLRIMGIIWRME